MVVCGTRNGSSLASFKNLLSSFISKSVEFIDQDASKETCWQEHLKLAVWITPSPSLFVSVVKYIKEMSAFFKGGSTTGPPVLDSPPATPQKQTDPALNETRTIWLRMCHVTRRQCPPDTEDRCRHTCGV